MATKTNKETVNSRLLLLKSTLELGQNEFCAAAKISTATFHSIKNDGVIRSRTVRNICEALGANQDWVFKGEGEMFAEKESAATVADNSILAKTFAKLEEQLDKKDALIDRLTQIIMSMGGPGGGQSVKSFLKAFNKAGSPYESELLKVA